MTKQEKEKMIDTLNLWFEEVISFSKSFDFTERKDALEELKCRSDRTIYITEFLEECGFISDEKYLEIVDNINEMWDNLNIGRLTNE